MSSVRCRATKNVAFLSVRALCRSRIQSVTALAFTAIISGVVTGKTKYAGMEMIIINQYRIDMKIRHRTDLVPTMAAGSNALLLIVSILGVLRLNWSHGQEQPSFHDARTVSVQDRLPYSGNNASYEVISEPTNQIFTLSRHRGTAAEYSKRSHPSLSHSLAVERQLPDELPLERGEGRQREGESLYI